MVTDSYWDKTTSLVQSSAGGGIGMTSAQMMAQADFVSATTANSPNNPSWDFAGTWVMYEGLTDPLLSSFMTPLTVTANNTSRIYGQATPAFGVSYSATPNGNLFGTVVYSGSAPTATNVGSYVIAPSGLYSNQGGYIIRNANGTLTVDPARLTVTGQSAGNKVYDGTLGAVLTGGGLSGVISGDTATLTLTQAGSFVSKNVGSGIGVTASDSVGGASTGNYTLTEPTGLTANITPAMLTYSAAAVTFTVGQTPSDLSGTLSGFVLAENQVNATAGTLVWTTTAAMGSRAGRYAIDGGGLTAANYVFAQAPGDAMALTLQSGSSPVIPPVPPPLSGPDAATLALAQTAAGTLLWGTNIRLAPAYTREVAPTQSVDSDLAICSHVSDGMVIDKRIVINAMVPSLRIVCGGVKLPDNVVDGNAL